MNQNMKSVQKHPFPPLYDKDSKVLILGSFPSTSPANAAWSLDRLVKVWKAEIKNTNAF